MAVTKKKTMYTLEYPIRCSPSILYEFLARPVGLQEWFADKVDQRDSHYYFTWNGATDPAEVLEEFENHYIRFRWEYMDSDEFFEFRVEQSPVTNETILRITDFADKGEIKDQEQLWSSQVNDLKHRIGA
jgi:uncharacterized protein YndB with AHSA1/START domain